MRLHTDGRAGWDLEAAHVLARKLGLHTQNLESERLERVGTYENGLSTAKNGIKWSWTRQRTLRVSVMAYE